MSYPAVITNTPSQLPGKSGLNLEFYGSYEEVTHIPGPPTFLLTQPQHTQALAQASKPCCTLQAAVPWPSLGSRCVSTLVMWPRHRRTGLGKGHTSIKVGLNSFRQGIMGFQDLKHGKKAGSHCPMDSSTPMEDKARLGSSRPFNRTQDKGTSLPGLRAITTQSPSCWAGLLMIFKYNIPTLTGLMKFQSLGH